jgi:hypothetical protein
MKNRKQINPHPTCHDQLVRPARIEERPRVFICSPFAGDIDMNVRRARRFCAFAVDTGYTPLAPHLFFPQFLDEDDPDQRERGICMGLGFLPDCQEIWVFGERISAGMNREIALAGKLGLMIRFFSNQCEEVPDHAQ